MAMHATTHSAARWDTIDSVGSQVFDAYDSLRRLVRAPKITLLATKSVNNNNNTTNTTSTPHASGRATSLPNMLPAARATFRHQFRRRSLTFPTTTNTSPATVALRSEVPYRAPSLPAIVSATAPARSMMSEIQWEHAWLQLPRAGVEREAARHSLRSAASRRVSNSCIPGIRRASLSGTIGEEPVAVHDAASAPGCDLARRKPAYVPLRRGSM